MRYLVTLKPLEPFLFGGDNTFGKLGNEVDSTYLVKSRYFPQQSAILGMIKKEIMIQSATLTRKIRGEWVDKYKKEEARTLVGSEKFDIIRKDMQNFGAIKRLSPLFLMQNTTRYIKKVDIDDFVYEDGLIRGYNPKKNIFDKFVSLDSDEKKSYDDIFEDIDQTGNKIGGEDNSLFKKSSYALKDGFRFAFYLECDYDLKESIVHLGADRSSFKIELTPDDDGKLDYQDKNGYLVLLSDAYITLSLRENCDFAVTSEISYRSLTGKKSSMTKNKDPQKNRQNITFQKSEKIYLYEKGSVIINPSETLMENLNNENCQQAGYNIHTYTQGE